MIALPDELSVLIVAVPDLWPVPTSAVTALDPAGENADGTFAVPPFGTGGHQDLDHLEGLGINDSLVVILDIILQYFALVHFLFLGLINCRSFY